MGIISTLLTGGSILGKICQTISQSVMNTVETDNCTYTVRVSDTSINGVRFTEVSDGDTVRLIAFNTDVDRYACVTYPNGYGEVKGEQVFIPPTKKTELNLRSWNNVPTDLPFYVQKMDLRETASADNNRVIVAFKNLPLNETDLVITNTTLTASTSYLKVFFPTAGLGDLNMAEFTSESGIRATLREPIPASHPDFGITKYNISFPMLGFNEDDVISGLLQFGIAADESEKLKAAADQAALESDLDAINQYLCEVCNISK